MKALALKIVAFVVIFFGAADAAGVAFWHGYASRISRRMAVLFENEFSRYGSALIGTSVFASYYVNREDQTIWMAFERESGLPTLPAALNGAGAGDLLAITRHLATRLKSGTLVFVEIHPAKAWDRSMVRYRELPPYADHYDDDSLSTRAWNTIGLPLFTGLLHFRELLRSSQLQGSGGNYDRTWDRDGDFALKRYRTMERSFAPNDVVSRVDFSILEEIRATLERHSLKPIFVMTPLNGSLIARYESPDAQIRQYVDLYHRTVTNYLRERQFAVIDLYSAVPSEGFADLYHLNALGNALLARALAARLGDL